MAKIDNDLSETDTRHPKTRYSAIRSTGSDERPWIADSPVCEPLQSYHIAHLGVLFAPSPFRIVRTQLEGSYFLAAFAGRGKVLIDGRWKICKPGQAFLLPPGTLQAFHSMPGQDWHFGWVRYRERLGQKPMAAVNSPVLADFAGEAFHHALLGLHAECGALASPANISHWIELIQNHVKHFAQPVRMDERVRTMWESVGEDLAEDWNSSRLASESHLSEKQLERLCVKELGRTPRQHLIWLRMQRAAEMLTAGEEKVATIAHAVGYRNAFVFSTTFKRVMGWTPSEYPGRK